MTAKIPESTTDACLHQVVLFFVPM